MNNVIDVELRETQELREKLMQMLTDEDLAYRLPGQNPTLGELCEQIGHVQQVYIQSFRSFTQDWGYRGSAPGATNSVASLQAWYRELDAELAAAWSELSDEEIHQRQIDRGPGFSPSPYANLNVYREALLIFYAKASVYLKALEKQVTDQWESWIG